MFNVQMNVQVFFAPLVSPDVITKTIPFQTGFINIHPLSMCDFLSSAKHEIIKF